MVTLHGVGDAIALGDYCLVTYAIDRGEVLGEGGEGYVGLNADVAIALAQSYYGLGSSNIEPLGHAYTKGACPLIVEPCNAEVKLNGGLEVIATVSCESYDEVVHWWLCCKMLNEDVRTYGAEYKASEYTRFRANLRTNLRAQKNT